MDGTLMKRTMKYGETVYVYEAQNSLFLKL